MNRGLKRYVHDLVPRVLLGLLLLIGYAVTAALFIAFEPLAWLLGKFEKHTEPTDWRK